MDIVQLLVDNGAIVNIPGYHNNTPLHDAVENNHIDIVKFLQTNGADNTIRLGIIIIIIIIVVLLIIETALV